MPYMALDISPAATIKVKNKFFGLIQDKKKVQEAIAQLERQGLQGVFAFKKGGYTIVQGHNPPHMVDGILWEPPERKIINVERPYK